MATVSVGVFLLADSSWNRNSRRSPGTHPHRTKRHESGNHPPVHAVSRAREVSALRVGELPPHHVAEHGAAGPCHLAVQGDARTYGNPIMLRPVSSEDAVTADWSRVPYDVLSRISTRITNECRGINRVVLDVTSKPAATIEWE